MAFRFKQFTIDDSRCAMKVGTDSVLLGAWAVYSEARRILDVGTGCGLLALMAAQQSSASIVAIDIDGSACEQAMANFASSPWASRLECSNTSLEQFGLLQEPSSFDHIISNPPYFSNSLKSPGSSRNMARHNDNLPFETLAASVKTLLCKGGKFSLIIPLDDMESFIKTCHERDLELSRMMVITPKANKMPNRVLLEFTNDEAGEVEKKQLTIRDISGEYTADYKNITSEFYLYF